MIAFLKHEGQTLVLELTPLAGKPGYFDASVLHQQTATKPEKAWRAARRESVPRASTIASAELLRDWLKKNPGKHPLFNSVREALGVESPGSAGSIARAAMRNGWLSWDQTARPQTIESV